MNDSSSLVLVQKRSTRYLLFDLAILACLIAVGWKLLPGDRNPTSSTPPDPAVAVQYNDKASVQVQVQVHDQPDQAVPPWDPLLCHEEFKINDIVEVYDPDILPSHAFYAKIVGIISNGDAFAIEADIPSLNPGDNAGKTISAKVERSAVRAFEPYEFNAPVICDWSGSQYGMKLAPGRIVSYQKTENYEGYLVVHLLDDKLEYSRAPLARIRRPVDDDATATTTSSSSSLDVGFKIGMTPPYQSKIDGYNHLLRGVVEFYDDESKFAQPMIIWKYKEEIGYNVISAIHETPAPSPIKAEYLHPYQMYERGTKGLCNISVTRGEIIMRPCTVLSHSVSEIGFVHYEVSYYASNTKDKELVTESMSISFSKIKRVATRFQDKIRSWPQ